MTLETLTENSENLYYAIIAILGVVALAGRKYIPTIYASIKSNDAVSVIVSEVDAGTFAKVVEKLSDAGLGLEVIYNMATMTDAELKSFVNAMLELGGATSDERDTVVSALANGKAADMDYIFENVDVAALKILITAFKQLDMTAMWTGKDPTADMKEKLYQAVKTALTQSNGELAALASVVSSTGSA